MSDKYVCEIVFRRNRRTGKIDSHGEVVTDAYIVSASSEFNAKQRAWTLYAREHGVSTVDIAVRDVKKM